MLTELAVTDLGVIPELSLVLGPGMTALTGETGAGKTLVVTAIELLVGGRAEATMVRPGAGEARVQGRFVTPEGDEVVVERVVPATGRSRAYVDGRMSPVTRLAELGAGLVDLHGQHSHQSLLHPSAQRAALDRWGSVDLAPLAAARAHLATLERALEALGGDSSERDRQIDLARFELEELSRAALDDPDEEVALEAEEDLLAGAAAHRLAAAEAHEALSGDGQAGDDLARALVAVSGRAPFVELEARLRSLAAELGEVASELRARGEAIEEDPVRLDVVRARRRLLHQLRRRYQAATLADLRAVEADRRRRIEELEGHDRRAGELERDRIQARTEASLAAAQVGQARRGAAPGLAAAVEARLRTLALPRARLQVSVGPDDPGDDVTFLLGANPGEPLLPLARVASGGELSRTMLALRLALGPAGVRPDGAGTAPGPASTTASPPAFPPASTPATTLVFDEVDAGIGGEAALAVGRSLATLGADFQVLVVTHLPQVAAFADAQVAVSKGDGGDDEGGRTVATARLLDSDGRVVEMSRMLSGQPGSDTAQGHAAELLSVAARERSQRAGAEAGSGAGHGRPRP